MTNKYVFFKAPTYSMGGTPSRGASMMKGSGTTGGQKQSIPLEDALNILLQGFLKGKRHSATNKSFPVRCYN